MNSRWWLVTGLCAAVVTLSACSNVTSGTPMADPDQTGLTTTTTTTPTTTSPSPTRGTRPPAPPPPGGLADTTCGDFVDMDDATQRQVIDAIGETNELIALNPELWVGMAEAVCTFSEPETPVRDVVVG